MINLSVDSHRSSVIEAQFSSLQILQFIFLKSLDCTRINSTTQGYVFIYINMVEQTGLNIVFCLGNVTHASPVTASREHDNSAHLVSGTRQVSLDILTGNTGRALFDMTGVSNPLNVIWVIKSAAVAFYQRFTEEHCQVHTHTQCSLWLLT